MKKTVKTLIVFFFFPHKNLQPVIKKVLRVVYIRLLVQREEKHSST